MPTPRAALVSKVYPPDSASFLDAIPTAPAAWDEAIAGFDQVCQEQTATFATARWPGLRTECWLFREGADVVGGAMVLIQPLPLRVGGIAVCKMGPMLRDLARADRTVVYGAMVDSLVAEYATRRRMTLSIAPQGIGPGKREEFEWLARRGFRVSGGLPYPDQYTVDLSLPDKLHRAKLHQKWRYHLSKSERNGLSFEVSPADRLAEFADLYRTMTSRKRFPDHSAFPTLPHMLASPVEALRPCLFLVRAQDRPVAGAAVFVAGSTAVFLYGATTDEALQARAGYFLHWQIIGWLKRHTKARRYELGGNAGFSGLHQFKKGMVGEAGSIEPVPPVSSFAVYPLPRIAGAVAFRARQIAKGVQERLAVLPGGREAPDLAISR